MMLVKSSTLVRPFCNAVAVIESPVDEEQRDSGIIIPLPGDERHHVRRGVITHLGSCNCEDWKLLEEGTVIYYVRGIKINDVMIVDHDDIVAYEEGS